MPRVGGIQVMDAHCCCNAHLTAPGLESKEIATQTVKRERADTFATQRSIRSRTPAASCWFTLTDCLVRKITASMRAWSAAHISGEWPSLSVALMSAPFACR